MFNDNLTTLAEYLVSVVYAQYFHAFLLFIYIFIWSINNAKEKDNIYDKLRDVI